MLRCERVLAPIRISAVPEDAKHIMHVFVRSNHIGLFKDGALFFPFKAAAAAEHGHELRYLRTGLRTASLQLL